MYKSKVEQSLQRALADTVNDYFNLDIHSKCREVSYVMARSIYYAILRELGYGYSAIAKSLDKNHATIIHSLKTLDDLMSYDKNLKHDFQVVRDIFFDDASNFHFINSTRSDLIKQTINLQKQNNSLNLSIERLNDSLNQRGRYEQIVNQLEERNLTDEQLSLVSRKLNNILNGIHH